MGQVAHPNHYGDREYAALTLSGSTVVGVLSGAVYFELSSPTLSESRLELIAQTILTYA